MQTFRAEIQEKLCILDFDCLSLYNCLAEYLMFWAKSIFFQFAIIATVATSTLNTYKLIIMALMIYCLETLDTENRTCLQRTIVAFIS